MAHESLHPSGSAPAPPGATADVWVIDLAAPRRSVAEARSLLSAYEARRADSILHEAARRRYLFARAALRRILGSRLGAAPEAVEIRTGPNGKPTLGSEEAGRLHFNLSHTAELAVVAVSTDGAIGVDVEKLRPMREAMRLAERFFTANERAALRALPEAEQAPAFFNLWTRKEAIAKATGEGIPRALARFEVSLGRDARLLAIDGGSGDTAAWSLCAFTPAPGHAAAAAMREPGLSLRLHGEPE